MVLTLSGLQGSSFDVKLCRSLNWAKPLTESRMVSHHEGLGICLHQSNMVHHGPGYKIARQWYQMCMSSIFVPVRRNKSSNRLGHFIKCNTAKYLEPIVARFKQSRSFSCASQYTARSLPASPWHLRCGCGVWLWQKCFKTSRSRVEDVTKQLPKLMWYLTLRSVKLHKSLLAVNKTCPTD